MQVVVLCCGTGVEYCDSGRACSLNCDIHKLVLWHSVAIVQTYKLGVGLDWTGLDLAGL